jgi:uncharacterized repeat protein (TIGR03803 family)
MNHYMCRSHSRVGKVALPSPRVHEGPMKAAAIAIRTSLTLAFLATAILAATLLAAPPAAQAQTESVLYYFEYGNGDAPNSTLVLDSQGNLFGTTKYGGTHEKGVAFELAPDGTESVLHNFCGSVSAYPNGLISDAAGNLYGVTAGLGLHGGHGYYGTVFELKNRSKIRKGLRYGFDRHYVFTNNNEATSGAVPVAGLVVDAQGDIFGTTSMGGAFDSGTIFEVTPPRTESVLYNFTGGADGFHPYGGLIRDSQGNYYGTTFQGGIAGSGCNFGCGVVFKLAADGTETVLYDFTGGTDGSGPLAGLVLDGQGNLYGTTVGGGNLTCSGTGCGVVFKIAAAGGETVLYSFLGASDGAHPQSSLILDGQGNLYGTAYEGGGSNCNGYGCGTVFEVSATGEETVLYRFTGGTDGGTPLAGLVMDGQGNLYGTTESGGSGCVSGCGVIFKITP